jgi:transposase
MLVNAARGLTKSYGERLRGCNARGMKPKAAQDLSPELKSALEPMMSEIESVSERICEYDHLLESMTRNRYPEAERLKQIKEVGTLIALTYMLTLEDPRRFRKSRDAACYVGLQPGRRNSGQSEPQMHISKEGVNLAEHGWWMKSVLDEPDYHQRVHRRRINTDMSAYAEERVGHSNCSGRSGGDMGYVPGSRNLLYTQLDP